MDDKKKKNLDALVSVEAAMNDLIELAFELGSEDGGKPHMDVFYTTQGHPFVHVYLEPVEVMED